jgi:hypothetical protein
MDNNPATELSAAPDNIRSEQGQFIPGASGNPGGKPKGTVNKSTALLKDAILRAAQKAGGDGEDGLVNYLEEQARENPGPFLSLLGKVLPMTVAGDKDNPLKLVTRIELVAPSVSG